MIELTDGELDLLHAVLDHARSGATEELEFLLDAGVPVNLTSPRGDSLLMLAAYHQQAATVAVLLGRGADHARVNDRGQTALGAATFRRNEQIVRSLLDAGADPDLGRPSARELADHFGLSDVAALLGG
ncbi:ankyrin repeat domain-containing protein [Spongisporangium articulatum]|uniref:Ankyrin repeat domain-containing protein n=1 Tax=Spongisporangium articulatum TaxID=3362603 RepID=A0ABW8ALV0_9ACTN